MNTLPGVEHRSALLEKELQNWIARWQTAAADNDYTKIYVSLGDLIDFAAKYPPAMNVVKKLRDDMSQVITSDDFLRKLKGDSDLKIVRQNGEAAVQRLIQPGIQVRIFVELNWIVGDPEATTAYYDKVLSSETGLADELGRLLWDYWLRLGRWDRVLHFAERRGWLSDVIPDADCGEFVRHAEGIFAALLRVNDVPRMLALLDRLDGMAASVEEKMALQCINKFYRQEAPRVVQQRMDHASKARTHHRG